MVIATRGTPSPHRKQMDADLWIPWLRSFAGCSQRVHDMKRTATVWLRGLATSALGSQPGVVLALVLTGSGLHAADIPGGFWLEAVSVSNGVAFLSLHGTEPFTVYEIQTKPRILADWAYELTVVGAEGASATSFSVAMGARSNALFLRALSYADPPLDGVPLTDLQLWLQASAGVELADGAVATWRDRSGWNNHATQPVVSARPTFVPAMLNGRPVVRFDGATDYFNLPDFLGSNTQAEAYIVLRTATNAPPSARGLWHFGSVPGGVYPSSAAQGVSISASFGRSSLVTDTGTPLQPLDQFHLYNAASEPGRWISRINGAVHYVTDQNVVGFTSTPLLGRNRPSNFPDEFEGDIAELMVFNRVLTPVERDAVGVYLNRKYGFIASSPGVPVGLSAAAISPSQVSLTWRDALEMGTTGYVVERKPGPGGAYERVADVRSARSHLDTGLTGGLDYVYRVKAWNLAGQSGASEEVAVSTPAAGEALPTDSLQLWLRADAGVLRSGAAQTVGIWQDQSGRGNNANQTASGSRPIYIESTSSNLPSLRFDGANDYLSLPDFLSSNVAGEVYVVLRAATTTPASHRGLWHFGSGTGGYYPASSGYISAGFGRAAIVLNTGVPTERLDALHLYNVTSQPGSWISRINGAVHYSTTANLVDFTATPLLGRNRPSNSPNHFEGDIAEVMLFDRVLTPGERGAAGLYLNSRHSFVDLPHGDIQLTVQTMSASQIVLAWSQTGATNEALYTYTVERRSDTNAPFVGVAQVSGDTRYFDEGLLPATTYTYRVRNTLIAEATPSNEAAAATLACGSPVPANNLALWLLADNLSLGNGAPVAEWKNFRNTDQKAIQPDPNSRPVWAATAFNGGPSVQFGDGAFLELPAVLSNATSAEVYIVLQSATNAPPANQGLWRFNNSGPTWFPDTNGAVADAFGSESARASLPPLPELTAPLLYTVSASPGLWQSRMNGPVKQWLTNNSALFDGVPLLGRSTGGASEPFAGQIAELLVFDRALSEGERLSVRNALALKHSLNLDLPAVPSALILTRTNGNERLLSWTALSGSENGLESHFVIERQADTNGPFLPLIGLPRSDSGFLDTSGLTGIEHRYRLKAVNSVGETASDPLAAAPVDTDNDGLSDDVETVLGTNPDNADTDGDGLPDGWEVAHGLSPFRSDGRHGADGDFDHDGLSNSNELANLTEPADGVAGDEPLVRLSVHRPAGSAR